MLKLCRKAMMSGLFTVAAFTAPIDGRQATAKVDHIRNFAGFWKAPEYKVPTNTELDVAVWGKGASKVRNVELSIEPDGDGVLRVFNSVVDPRSRVIQYSASVVEARLKLEEPEQWDDKRIEPLVKVVAAEERYLDGTNEKMTVEGLKVSINSMTNMQTINIRYDTARGTGSFGETLTRQSSRGPKKTASNQSAKPSTAVEVSAGTTSSHS